MKKKYDIEELKQQLVNELEAARLIAQETKSSAAMVSASIGKAKLLGLINDKSKKEDDDEYNKIHPILVKFVKETEKNSV